jgi:hypothetical protein
VQSVVLPPAVIIEPYLSCQSFQLHLQKDVNIITCAALLTQC